MARGMERTDILRDDRDRETFVERGLAWLMRRLVTSHAVRFNLRGTAGRGTRRR